MQFAGNLSERVSGETKFFEFEYFSFLLFSFFISFFVFKFQRPLNFDFSKVLFRRILGWIFFQLNFLSVEFYWQNFSSWLSFTFISCEATFKKRVKKPFFWLIFPAFTVLSSNSYWEFNSSSKRGSHFLVPHCEGLLLPSPLRPNQVPHVVSLIFSLEIIFYMV